MQICITTEIAQLHTVAPAIGGMPHMHRLMQISHKMNHNLKRELLLILALLELNADFNPALHQGTHI